MNNLHMKMENETNTNDNYTKLLILHSKNITISQQYHDYQCNNIMIINVTISCDYQCHI